MTPATDVHGSLLDFALSCKQGITIFCTGSVTTDAPFTYCTGEIFVRGSDFKIVAYDLQSREIATNRKTNNMSNWDGWNYALGSIKYVYFNAECVDDKSEYYKQPVEFLKTKWEELDINSIYLATIICGFVYTAIIQKYSRHTYGSIFIISYAAARPIYARLNNGTWEQNYISIEN